MERYRLRAGERREARGGEVRKEYRCGPTPRQKEQDTKNCGEIREKEAKRLQS